MPAHDWRNVAANVFHDFHNVWIGELRTALNRGILPPDYYALCDQPAGPTLPDVLTLQMASGNGSNGSHASEPSCGGVATATTKPPKVRLIQRFEEKLLTRRRKTLVIRHTSGDRVIAMIEILSPGNKASTVEFRRFLDKAVGALNQDIHLLIVDLFPPGKRDPQGIHGAILEEFGEPAYEQPADKPLTLVSYSADIMQTAYVEPIAVGDVLPPMPLFLDPESYVEVPLEATYEAAYVGVPRQYRHILES